MKEKQILVLIKKPNEAPTVEPMFDNSLAAFQEAVGGYIETYYLAPNLCIICNEEGKLMGLPYNTTIGREDFVGTIMVVGSTKDEFCSVPAAKIPHLRDILGGVTYG